MRGAVQGVHGLSEHAGRYERLARALTTQGFAVAALDHRGHGLTAGSTGPGGFGEGATSDAVLDDVRDLGERLAAGHPRVPRFLLGHSLGSAVALASAERDGADLAGLVLSGPIGVAPQLAAAVPQLEAAVAGGLGEQPMDALGAFTPPSSRPARPTTGSAATRGRPTPTWPTRCAATTSRPRTATAPACSRWSPARRAPRVWPACPAGLPVLLLAGQRDPVGGTDAAQVAAPADPLRDGGLPVELRVYPDARHEVFNETNRDEVTGDLLGWLGARLGG
ncbi:alpha/beta fold hydrolase [Geodermatophilus africanus]|uniref:alpha/beta fold hydrolase n=1 Tax=Geodermatophilus africanus TaxID=1137993 RepID=UPI000A770C56